MSTNNFSNIAIASDGVITVQGLESYSPKKQKSILLLELTSMHNALITNLQIRNDSFIRITKLKAEIAASHQMRELKKLEKTLRETDKIISTSLSERQGIIRTAKVLGIDASKEIESIQQIAIKQIESNHK